MLLRLIKKAEANAEPNTILETNNQNGGYKKINEKKRKRNTRE
jgi:hypothetical protein